MKILESKFYKPIQYLKREYRNDRIIFDERGINEWNSSDTPFTDLLDFLLPGTLKRNSNVVIREKNLEKFEKCTDFVTFSYSKDKNKIIEAEKCYFHKKYEIFIVITSDLSNDSDKELYEDGVFRVKNIYYDNSDLKHKENFQKFFDKYLEKYISPNSKISLLVREYDNITLNEYKIFPKKIDFETMYNDDFLDVSKHIVSELKNSSKGIVLLHGLPGSGKTNYIKWLTGEISNKKFIFVPTTMISSLTEPSFINFFIENKNSILVFEDCENYISERSSGNPYTDVVSTILNLADGILSDVVECQIICTFNANIGKIDKALLRKGRLIAEYCFKEIEIEKVNKYFKSQKSKQKTDKPLLLTEMMNLEKNHFTEKEEKKKIGFDVK
ncbi:ATPase [Candidatus Gracilibacteria bacterium]|nr:MAG: ATPase [Candidatus Gracilibacteria bacterium]